MIELLNEQDVDFDTFNEAAKAWNSQMDVASTGLEPAGLGAATDGYYEWFELKNLVCSRHGE